MTCIFISQSHADEVIAYELVDFRSASRDYYRRGDSSYYIGFRVLCVAPLQ